MNNNKIPTRRPQNRAMPIMKGDPTYIEKKKVGAGFAVLLVTTVVLLIGVTISLFIAMAADKDSGEPYIPSGNTNKNPSSTQATSGNTEILYPTKPSRTSYVIGRSSDLINLTTEIKSNNTILVELGSYESIVEKNADAKIYPASMTKVMTLLVACERVTSLDTLLTITQEHVDYVIQSGGGSSFFVANADLVGEKITVKDALYLISYKSDTMASFMIAEHIAGSEDDFVLLMNQKARDIGLTSTNFTNCTGLYNENHYSTCREIAAIMAYAMDNELAYEILFSTELYSFSSHKFYKASDPTARVTYFLYSPDWYGSETRFYKKADLNSSTVVAGKTGYIDESGVSLVSVAKGDNGKMYVNVTVGLPKGSGLSESKHTSEVKYIYNTYVT